MRKLLFISIVFVLIACDKENFEPELIGTTWTSFAFTVTDSKIEAYYVIRFTSNLNLNMTIETKQQFVISEIPNLTYEYDYPQIVINLPKSILRGEVKENIIDFEGFVFTKK